MSARNFGGGGAKYFFLSGPKCPPSRSSTSNGVKLLTACEGNQLLCCWMIQESVGVSYNPIQGAPKVPTVIPLTPNAFVFLHVVREDAFAATSSFFVDNVEGLFQKCRDWPSIFSERIPMEVFCERIPVGLVEKHTHTHHNTQFFGVQIFILF